MYCLNKKILASLESEILLAHYFGWYGSVWNDLKQFAKALIAIFVLRESVTSTSDGKSKILFFISGATQRKDHGIAYENVMNLVPQKREVRVTSCCTFNFGRTAQLLAYSFFELLRNRKMNVGANFIVLERKIRANDLICQFSRIDFTQVSLAVVYTDEHIEEYTFISYMKTLGVKTATLQHGAFIAKREVQKQTVVKYQGLELCNSRADYFLAWNQFTKEEAIKSGMAPEKIFVLGIPMYINCQRKAVDAEKKGVFGVILNGSGFSESNEAMIKFANALAKEKGLRFYLKYHPGYKEYVYDSLVDKECFAGNLAFDSTISEYLEIADFTLIGDSTVFIELVFSKHRMYRYNSGEHDKFRDVKMNSFVNEEELLRLYDDCEEDGTAEIFEYLCHTENPAENYIAFFSTFE